MRNVILLVLLSFSSMVYAQKQAAVWYFGVVAGLNFNCSPPRVIHSENSPRTLEGTSTICDTAGNLLFYTDGCYVYDRTNQRMPNGSDIGQYEGRTGLSSSQGSIIIPVPESDSLFYIFTTDNAENKLKKGFRYSIVDLSKNNGLGDLTVRDQLLQDSVVEKLTAVHHANGRDIWVLVHKFESDVFLAYLVTSAGLQTTPVVSRAGQIYKEPVQTNFSHSLARGQMKFSPDGKSITLLPYSDHHVYPLKPEIFNFDDQTGDVSLRFTVEDNDSVTYYGASFSPDSKLVYFTSGWHGNYIHQFQIEGVSNSKDFLASKYVVDQKGQHSNPSLPSGISLGPDGKIYTSSNKTWVNVIHRPNEVGANCQFQDTAIVLKNCRKVGHSSLSMPNHIQSFFRTQYIGNECIIKSEIVVTDGCVDSLVNFTNLSSGVNDLPLMYVWDFGDPSSGTQNRSEGKEPKHTYSKPGTYDVRLSISSADSLFYPCLFDSTTTSITIIDCDTVDSDTGTSGGGRVLNLIPNSFSPNADGINDQFAFELTEGPFDFRVYNLWGELIYETGPEFSVRWDGTYRGEVVPLGVYFYIMRFYNQSGGSYKERAGTIHALK